MTYNRISRVIDISIKEVFTTNSRVFTIETGWNTREFIEYIYPLASNYFRIELNNIEVTADGDPYSRINTITSPEYGPAIEPSEISIN